MNNEIALRKESLNNSHGCITVTNKVGVRVTSVHKLFSAILLYKIDNVVIALDGLEVPQEQRQSIGGSGKALLELIAQAGVSAHSAFRCPNYALTCANTTVCWRAIIPEG